MRSPNHALEEDRLAFLRRLEILDTIREEVYDDFALLASTICRTPIAALSLVDQDRQWFKASVGLDVRETSRESSFCSYAILQEEPLIVPNAELDERFADNELVTGDFHLRFYAGVPVFVDGFPLGSLCVIDREPRDISSDQISALSALARQISHTFEARLIKIREQEYRDLLEDAERAFEHVRRRYESLFRVAAVAQICTDPDGVIREINEMAESLFGVRDFQVVGTDLGSVVPSILRPRIQDACRADSEDLAEELLSDPTSVSLPMVWHGCKRLFNSEDVLTGFLHSFRRESTEQAPAAFDLNLIRLALTDELTGIANRRGLVTELEREFRSIDRDQVSLLLLDIDHFKQINDTFGHMAGDQVLKKLGEILQTNCRSGDLPARFGGEEFAVILPRTDADSARYIGERLRRTIAEFAWDPAPVTVSIGIATTSAMVSTPNGLLSLADVRLYEAKRTGRNRTVAA